VSTEKPTLYLVGAGNFGRELYSWLDVASPASPYRFGGFLDDTPDPMRDFPIYQDKVAGTIREFQPRPNDRLVLAIADPKGKLAVAESLRARGGKFATFVHRTVVLGDQTTIGEGTVICPNSVISCFDTIGEFVTINVGCMLGHDVVLERGVTLSPHVALTGYVVLGEGVFVGTNVSVLPKVKVGAWAKLGAGSAVVAQVAAGVTVLGVPGRQIG
jgi:sugar O-acyltransferase (sialic acid O-acetyltransferase NeuD family)